MPPNPVSDGLLQEVRSSAALDRSLRSLFDASPIPMWIYDVETLRFVEVNHAAIGTYGYSRREFLSMSIREIRPPEDVARLDELVEDCFGKPSTRCGCSWRLVQTPIRQVL